MADDSPASGYRRFTAAAPTGQELPTDAAVYGTDIPGEISLRLLGTLDGKRVLDLGCGAGHASVSFARQGAKVIAVDPAPGQVAAARQAAEDAGVRVELHEVDLADLAFLRKDTVDVVFSAYALAEVGDLNRVFRQVHRVLKPEAILVFSLPHPAYLMLNIGGGDSLKVTHRYHDDTPRRLDRGDTVVEDHPRTLAEVFVSLRRANFGIDTLLEPEASPGPGSPGWTAAVTSVPPTVIFRARKEGI